MCAEGVRLNSGLAIIIVALALIGAIALLGLLVLAFAVFLWLRAPKAPVAPPVAAPMPEPTHDDPATEVFDRGRLFEVFDSDDMDQTELVRLDGGILLDGRTDPAVMERVAVPGKGKP